MAKEVKAQREGGLATTAAQEDSEAFYHYGLIPASGLVEFPVVPKEGRAIPTHQKIDAFDLWNTGGGLDENISIFVAKARQYLSLSVRGLNFPSTTSAVVAQGKDISRTPYPGQVGLMTPERVRAAIQSCYRHFIRFPNGLSRMGDPAERPQIHDMGHGAKPAGYSDEQWAAHKREHAVIECPTFDRHRDVFVAEFVYLYKLDVDPLGVDRKEYTHNPNKYHVRWVPPISREFFDTPPKSVAEMYPQDQS